MVGDKLDSNLSDLGHWIKGRLQETAVPQRGSQGLGKLEVCEKL